MLLLSTTLAATVGDFPALAVTTAVTTAPVPAAPMAPVPEMVEPDAVVAEQQAVSLQRPVELLSQRSERSKVLVNPDGSRTAQLSPTPVRWRDPQGGWHDNDLTLDPAEPGQMKGRSQQLAVRLSGQAAGATTLPTDMGALVLRHPDATTVPVSAVASTATYRGGLSGGRDLVQQLQTAGVKETVVLPSRAAAKPNYQVQVTLPAGLTARNGGTGVQFIDSAGAVVAEYGGGLAEDSSPANSGLGAYTSVTSKIVGQAGPVVTLESGVSPAWLADPARVFPVKIDPTYYRNTANGDGADTYVMTGVTSSQWANNELRVGHGFGPNGNDVARALLKFYLVGAPANAAVSEAHLTINNFQASSCTGTGVYVQSLADNFGTTTAWSNQPVGEGGQVSGTVFAHGNSGCPGAWQNLDLTSLVKRWFEQGATNFGFRLQSNEQGTGGWKKFHSGETGSNSAPALYVTYSYKPASVAGRSVSPCSAVCINSGSVTTNSATPLLRGGATDADGGTHRIDFEVWNSTGSAMVTSGSVPNTPAGGNAAWAVPAGRLADGGVYKWRARAFDGVNYSQNWSSWIPITVDLTAPATPAVSSSTHPAEQWSTATTGTFSWPAGPADTDRYLYGLDQPSPSIESTGTSVTLPGMVDGPHTLYVRTKDQAGNLSPTATYAFSSGLATLLTPGEGDRTQHFVALQGDAPSDRTWVTYQWRRGTDSATPFVAVPTGDVTLAGTSTAPTWPQSRSGAGFPAWVWDVQKTLGGINAAAGPLQVQACFTGGICSRARTVQYVRTAFGDSFATSEIGPGQVSLTTGAYAVTAADVSVPSYQGTLDVGRTFTTLAAPATGAAAVFGPGWTADLAGPDAGAADLTLTDASTSTGGTVTLAGSDGSQTVYARTGTGTTYPWSYAGAGDAAVDGSTLTRDSASKFTLLEDDGTRTVFTSDPTGWYPTAIDEPGADDSSTFSYTNGLVTRILGPVPAGVVCPAPPTPLVAGCRALLLTYTTIAGTPHLTSVQYAAGADAPRELARYSYDPASGRLTAATDARTNLATTYSYVSDTQLATMKPAGLEPWNFTYDPAGRLATVTRLSGTQPAVQRMVYDLPLSGAGLPDVTGPAVASWAQRDLPVTGTAVFPASHPASATPAPTDWPFADLTYINANGRETNSASYGAGTWQVSTSEHDKFGNTVRELTPGNRAQALAPTADTDPTVTALADSAARAQLLDTDTLYDLNGTLAIDSYGPTHPAIRDDGSPVNGRAHTHTDYDQGAPAAATPYRLATTVTSSLQVVGGTDVDRRVTVNGYEPLIAGDTATSGWTLRQPTSVTTRMGTNGAASTNDITRVTYFNAAGQPIESRMPNEAANGGGAGTTLTAYYSGGTGPCGAHPEWAGLVCSSGPAAGPMPTKKVTGYTMFAQPLTTTETATTGAGTTTRTTTVGYDTADRPQSTAVTSSGATAGIGLPTINTTYDPATGLPTTTSSSAGTITVGYDNNGRTTSYAEPGNTTTTTYDIDGRPATVDDGKGTTTYTYDSSTEHRGLVTSLDTGMGVSPSTFNANYDADGQLIGQTYPNGLIAASRFDNTGDETDRIYIKNGTVLAGFSQDNGSSGQVRHATSTLGQHTADYSYDTAGRLTAVADNRSDGQAQ